MDLIQQLPSGGQERQDYEDFINRYQQGLPSEGYSDQEVMNRYQRVSSRVPNDTLHAGGPGGIRSDVAPQEREEFARYISQQAQQQHLNAPEFPQETDYRRFQDPAYLARATSDVRQKDPGLFDQLFGGGDQREGSILSNPIARRVSPGSPPSPPPQIMKRGGIG